MRRDLQRGMSMVELLVGCAVALLVAATASAVVVAQLRESRLLMAGTRLDQDLRSVAGIIARDLRRAGYWNEAAAGVASDGAAVPANPYGPAPSTTAYDTVGLSFSRDLAPGAGVDDSERFGFRLRSGALQMQLGAANWQTLTDTGVLVVTSFTVTPRVDEISLDDFCEQPCPASSTSCPPRQLVRSFELSLTARSAVDAHMVRALRTGVRVRNDAVSGSCEA